MEATDAPDLLPPSTWLARFSLRLAELLPNADAVTAWLFARPWLDDFDDLGPEELAERLAELSESLGPG